MSKVRVWKVKVKDVVAGHGMSLPSYTLPYDGWTMENPPERVIEAAPTLAELKAVRDWVDSISNQYCGESCPAWADEALTRLDKLIEEIEGSGE